MPLVSIINSFEEYETTSSCSGRIILLNNIEKKQPKIWHYVTHEEANPEEIFTLQKEKQTWFIQEGLILHIKCKTLENAQKLLTIARNLGLKHSGIIDTENPFIEIRDNERIETVLKNNSKEYIELLVNEANKKLKKCKEKITKLEKELKLLQ